MSPAVRSPARFRFTGIAFFAILAACSGGSGRGGGSNNGSSGGSGGGVIPPTTSPASATGMVVDESSSVPLSGVQVAITAWAAGATPNPIATTSATGTFPFTTTPGHYLLVIGSDSPNDARTTLHVSEQLNAGTNALTLPTPTAPPNVVLTAAQTSGNFRLQALSSKSAELRERGEPRAQQSLAACTHSPI
jgi:hypothetical protein